MPKSSPSSPSTAFEKTPPPAARFFKINSGKMHKRTFAPPDEDAFYHLVSHTAGDADLLGETDRDAFDAILKHVSEFIGIEVLTSTVIANRFELLIRVPNREKFCRRFEGPKGEEKLISHLDILYSKGYCDKLKIDIKAHRAENKKGNEEEIQKLLDTYRKRFCDVVSLMKELKYRLSLWYRKAHGRRGTFWATRYGCTLLENKEAVQNAAILIEFAAVSEGLVEHPKDYPWCGYARALGGSKRARRGLCRIVGWPIDHWDTPSKRAGKNNATGASAYREFLEINF